MKKYDERFPTGHAPVAEAEPAEVELDLEEQEDAEADGEEDLLDELWEEEMAANFAEDEELFDVDPDA